jgi:hypothetical protein
MLIGTYVDERGRFVEVDCDLGDERRGEEGLVMEHAHLKPAREVEMGAVRRFHSFEAAASDAEAKVLRRGGVFGQSAGALANARVSAEQAREMFADPHFVHFRASAGSA